MPKSNNSWGIEIGADAIKAVHLVRQGTGIELADYEVFPFKKVLTTPDIDADEAIRENLQKFITAHSLRRGKIFVSVPGSKAFAKFAKLPPVDPKKVPDIVKFEAVQQIPFPIEQVEWDYQIFTRTDSPDVEVGIFAITKDRVAAFLENFDAVGQSVDGMTLSALAVYNAMAYDLELTPDSPGTIFIDIGAISTDMIIAEGGRVWLRTLPIGGNNFTEALVRAFKLSFSKAEKLKREAGTSKYTRQIFQAMRPVFADLIQELQKTLGFYQTLSPGADISRMIGLGSSFRLPGMQKFLRQQLQMEVTRLDGFRRISAEGKQGADLAEHALNLGTAYGLALQGLGMEQVHANILPRRIVQRRLWRAKQPVFAASAGLMLAAATAAWVRLEIDKSEFRATLAESEPRVRQTLSESEQLVEKWRQIEGGADPRQRIENLRRILDYRDVWPKLMLDLTLAARTLNPQPELMAAHYEQVKKIPRDRRRRIYIESITAEYRFSMSDQASAQSALRDVAALSIDDIWGQKANGAEGGAAHSDAASQPPSFVVTVSGTSPYRDGPKLISQNFIQWLLENSKRNNRPYRIMATNKALTRIEKMRGDLARRRDQLAVPFRPTGTRGGGRDGPINRYSLDPLLPPHPLADEPREGDWTFEIQWTIELLRPEDTRLAEAQS